MAASGDWTPHRLPPVSECDRVFHVGDRLSVIPLHQGMTTNLHEEVHAVRNGSVEATWKVAGRGKVQ